MAHRRGGSDGSDSEYEGGAKKAKGAKKPKPYTKSELVTELARRADVDKKTAVLLLDSLEDIVYDQLKHVKCAAPLPGLLKIVVADKPARAARMGRNPHTGEDIKIAAKPASKTVRVRALKKLKEVAK
jgi:nucleoid DNA-binding protein